MWNNDWEKEFKIVSWPYSQSGPGFALVCLKSGKSSNEWFKTQNEAAYYAATASDICECHKCAEKLFEEIVLTNE